MDLFYSQVEKYLPTVQQYIDGKILGKTYGKILSGVKYVAAGIMICVLIRRFRRYLAEKRGDSDFSQTDPETAETSNRLKVSFSNIDDEDSLVEEPSTEGPVIQKQLNGLLEELNVEKNLQEQARLIVIDALTKAQNVVDSDREKTILERLILEAKVTCTPHQQANNILTDAVSQLTVSS